MNVKSIYCAFPLLTAIAASSGVALSAPPAESLRPILPEQRRISVSLPQNLRPAPLPTTAAPNTVSNLPENKAVRELPLDEAVRLNLANSQVIRILTGLSAQGSGFTPIDPAITNTQIDQNRGRFDPNVTWNNVASRIDRPVAVLDPTSPDGAVILGSEARRYDMLFGLNKTNTFGGVSALNVNVNPLDSKAPLSALDPQFPNDTQLRYTQPLLRGAGRAANLAPIYIARINTSRSFFQLKGAVQESVRSVIEGYWLLVAARVDVWARQQQVDQGEEAVAIAEARLRTGRGNNGPLLQAQTALANFRAGLISSQATLLDREAALRNVLGLAQSDELFIVPNTPPLRQKVAIDWDETQNMAAVYRPDLIELKLIIEADMQALYAARNNALPNLDATAAYQWNGLEGRTPARTYVRTQDGQFADWQIGVNFSVPLGLRASRASLRQQQLILTRDRANLDQGLHNASHQLAQIIRNIEQLYAQYRAFIEVRRAARENLERQLAFFRIGGTRNEQVIYLNVLQAITDWGNAVSNEALSLAQYNAALAALDANTGTILERHGIRFFEERAGFVGPLGKWAENVCYPARMPTGPNEDRYPAGDKPSDETFDLQTPTAKQNRDLDNLLPNLPPPLLRSPSDGVPLQDSPLQQPLQQTPLHQNPLQEPPLQQPPPQLPPSQQPQPTDPLSPLNPSLEILQPPASSGAEFPRPS